MALNVEWRLRHRAGPHEDVVLAAWAPVVPRGVQVGTMLFEFGDLRRMCDDGMSAAKVFDQLGVRVHAF
jgi:hypothetical protein